MSNTDTSVYADKMRQAEELISQHNTNVTLGGHKLPENLTDLIKGLGGTNDEGLKLCRESDLTTLGIPSLLARQLVAIFQKGKKTEENPAWISPRMADRMNFEQLLGNYDPDQENAVTQKLKELSKGQACIVFLPSGGIDVETSTKLLKEIRSGFKARPTGTIQVGDGHQRIYKVGENPDRTAEENPLYKGRALRPDGTCDQLNRSWDAVPQKVRQLVYLAAHETRELTVSFEGGHNLLDLILADPDVALKKLSQRYQKAATILGEKEVEGNLPTLKIRLGKAATVTKNDPMQNFNA